MIDIVCEKTDFTYPLLADIYYPIVEQSAYGNVDKQWVLDATIACSFSPGSSARKQDVKTNVVQSITLDNALLGRTRNDIRISSRAASNSITNIIITNIRDRNGSQIYVESSGPRKGQPTIFEVATNEPIVGAFGKTEYYKVIIRRSDNQGVNV